MSQPPPSQDLARILQALSGPQISTLTHSPSNLAHSSASSPLDSRDNSQARTILPRHQLQHGASRGAAKSDASSITTWPAALQQVTKHIAQDESVLNHVRKLLRDQHRHEREWHQARQSLLQTQRNRAEGSSKVADVLRSMGGLVDTSIASPTEADDAAELQRFDAKIYRASMDMARAMTADLKALQIPFFALHRELVQPSTSALLTASELIILKQRVLELLEDLCQD